MLRKVTLIILLIFCVHGSKAQNKLVIVPMLSEIDTSKDKIVITREDCFLMRGYYGTRENLRAIEHFAKHNKLPQWKTYARYQMTFFKETDQTNFRTIKKYLKNPFTPFYGRNDLIYEYSWSSGKYFSRTKYKNGEPINTVFPGSKVHIINIPFSADSTRTHL